MRTRVLCLIIGLGVGAVIAGALILGPVLGFHGVKHYVILLQNNMELRPTGGYLGSYAEVWLDHGRVKDWQIQDVGVPDGQIKGYVKEPDPIRKYLFQGRTPGWRLRDSNWNPDFPEAMKEMEWFFNEGGVKNIDGMLAVNLIPVKEILKITGPLTLTDYPTPVTAENFYQQAQFEAEHNFFPGSTQKQNFLGALVKALLHKLQSWPVRLQLVPVVFHALQEKQIMIAIKDVRLAELINKLDWDGAIRPVQGDYLMINEANLGINKTNCCLDRHITDKIVLDLVGGATHYLTLRYENHNPGTPKPPQSWGGGYEAYLRVFVPKEALLKGIMAKGKPVPPELIDQTDVGDKKVIGFLAEVGGGETGTFALQYQLPKVRVGLFGQYHLLLQKQSGIEVWPYTYSIERAGQVAIAPVLINIRQGHLTMTD